MTVGILAGGAYVPIGRLAVDGGERALAGHDEDAVTMAVAAGADCLAGQDRAAVDALIFASTTYPLKEKQGAALVARALDLRADLRTIDVAGSLRSGISALRLALELAAAGVVKRALVIASDARGAAPGSSLEARLGDAAVAFLVGDGDPIATLEGAHAVAEEIRALWRADGDAHVRSWEDRFVVEHAYRGPLEAVARGLAGTAPGDFDRVVLDAPDARAHAGAVRALRVDPARAADPLLASVGHAGAAHVPLVLAAALEQALPGQRLLAIATGDGAEALALRVIAAPPGGAAADLPRGMSAGEYVQAAVGRESPPGGRSEEPAPDAPRGVRGWLSRRQAIEERPARSAVAGGDGAAVSATRAWRDRDAELSLLAGRCRACGALALPAPRVCGCGKSAGFDRVRLSDRRGQLLSFTVDHFHPAPAPTVAGVVDVEGCRLYLQLADLLPDEARLALPVELTFRRIHSAGGIPHYFWKATPVRHG